MKRVLNNLAKKRAKIPTINTVFITIQASRKKMKLEAKVSKITLTWILLSKSQKMSPQ
jgi:hypothetical protein